MSYIVRVIRDPDAVRRYSSSDWESLLGELRSQNMVAKIGRLLEDSGLSEAIPGNARDTFAGAIAYAEYLQLVARHEVNEIAETLAGRISPVILLKGCAYLFENTAAHRGRGLRDIDLLVHPADLEQTEQLLEDAGWRQTETLSEYDNHYYRHLSHELPPKRHPRHQLELDLHHNILQPTHRLSIDINLLTAAAVPLGDGILFVLDRRDQILHSAAHLLMSDETEGGIRDIHDICALFEEGQATTPAFGSALVARAFELGLARALYYAVDFAREHTGLSLSPNAWEALRAARPSLPIDILMRQLLKSKLRTSIDPTRCYGAQRLAGFLLYIRSHWIRMPPLQLAKHLGTKALMRTRGEA